MCSAYMCIRVQGHLLVRPTAAAGVFVQPPVLPGLTDLVGHANVDLAVEAAEPAQRGVNAVGAVGGGHDDDMGAALEPVHQSEQLGHDAALHLALRLLTLGGDRVKLV